MRGTGLALLAAVALSTAASGQVRADKTSAHLALGIRQVQDGDFETAVFTLDSVVRKLEGEPARRRELVQALLFLGAAYVGLDHEAAARGKFRRVLDLDPALRISPTEFAPGVVKVFESELLAKTAAEKKTSARKFLFLGGAAAAGAVAYAVANPGAPANRDPVAEITVSPDGQAIAGITTMAFEATGSDRDGDPLVFSWDLGDGTTASGATATHVFGREGSFNVTLTASDGKGGSGTARVTVVCRTLSGVWQSNGLLNCVQTGTMLDCVNPNPERAAQAEHVRWYGTVSDPRNVDVAIVQKGFVPDFNGRCVGVVLPSGDCIRCVDARAALQYFVRQGRSCQ